MVIGGTNAYFIQETTNGNGELSVLDTTTDIVTKTVQTGAVPGLQPALTRDGKYLFYPAYEDKFVAVISSSTLHALGGFKSSSPASIAVAPNGLRVYVTNINDGTVTIAATRL